MLTEPGLIAVLNRPTGLTQGYACLVALTKPPGTGTMIITGTNIPRARNEAVRHLLSVSAFKWLLFIDDDQVYPPDSLARLLAVSQPIVGAIITGKYPNAKGEYEPWVFAREDTPEGKNLRRMAGYELVGSAVIPVAAVGTGFVLIRRKVFEAMSDPWFEFAHLGGVDGTGEDIFFMLKAQEAGFNVCVDKSLRIGHLTIVSAVLNDDGTSGLTHGRFVRKEYVK